MLKACSNCKIEKEYTATYFRLNKHKKSGLDSWCRDCANTYKRENIFPKGIVNKEKAQKARTLPECIICGLEVQLVVDHEHSTGYVRGGLCINCNLGLGHFKDNPELLRFAALYLEGNCACGNCDVMWGGQRG